MLECVNGKPLQELIYVFLMQFRQLIFSKSLKYSIFIQFSYLKSSK